MSCLTAEPCLRLDRKVYGRELDTVAQLPGCSCADSLTSPAQDGSGHILDIFGFTFVQWKEVVTLSISLIQSMITNLTVEPARFKSEVRGVSFKIYAMKL